MSSIFGIGANGATGFYPYLLERSLRFSDDSGSRLRFFPDSAGTSNTDWTISFWIKRNTISTLQDIIDVGDVTGPDTNTDTIQFQTDNTIPDRQLSTPTLSFVTHRRGTISL